MEPSRVESITQWPEPTTFRELQVFLGFANFYRRFIFRYSKVVSPMTDLLKGMQAGKKGGPFAFPAEAREAFEALKTTFTTAPILVHFDPTKRILVETDASGFAIGAVISQQVPDSEDPSKAHWHPVAFFSRKMTDAESRYETHDGELLAIVMAFRHWRHYLEGSQHPIIVKTDHDSLKYFMTKRELNRRQARWAEKLAAFDFSIEYRAGKSNPADGPSRRPDYRPVKSREEVSMLPTLQEKLEGAFMAQVAAIRLASATAMKTKSGSTALPAGVDLRPKTQGHWKHSVATYEPMWPDMPTPIVGQRDVQPHNVYADVSGQKPLIDQRMLRDQGYGHGPRPQDAMQAPLVSVPSQELMISPCTPREDGQSPRPRNAMQAPLVDERSVQQEGETPELHRLTPGNTTPEEDDAGCKQLIPRYLMVAAMSTMGAYDTPTKSLLEIVAASQGVDPFVQGQEWRRKDSTDAWTTDTNGILRRNGKVYIPDSTALREEILQSNHDDPHASHFGTSKTLELIQRHYYWPTLNKDVKEYVKTCTICQWTRVHRHKPYGELASLPQPSGPWEEISMDFITDLPPSAGEGTVFDSIMVVVDRYTKMSLYIPVKKTITAEEMATVFL